MKPCVLSVIVFLCYFKMVPAQEAAFPATLPNIKYHLTARPWQPLNIPKDDYLLAVEATVREFSKFQDSSGAIIDPYAKREVQYATPYFANAVATLLSAGKAADLIDEGIRAMNKSTLDIAEGKDSIPDNHGEFFLPALSSAIPLYAPFVSAQQLQTWEIRMAKPIKDILRGTTQNWRTYAMKGEWYRAKNGYINKTNAISWIENSWNTTQESRLRNNILNLYHDYTTSPDTWPYEGIGRSNLLAMIADGYEGTSKNEMLTLLKSGSHFSLLTQDPTGQSANGGRSSNHTWNDILLANGYEIMAEQAYKEGNLSLAGQYRHAAALGFKSAQRWRRANGTYSVTKNHFNPASRIGYASYSFFTNYNGNMIYHMAENFLRNNSAIPEEPSPNEIGGYTLVTDTAFATAYANAGGMHMAANLKGAVQLMHNQYWSALGVVRFARPGWDSRLGPSDGIREASNELGISFAPEFLENGAWVRLASIPERYEASFTTQFAHPLLVRCRIEYKPKSGKTGPSFNNDFIVTPDGILSTLTSDATNFGVTWPLLSFDGATELNTNISSFIAGTSYPGKTDQQNFIALHSSPKITHNVETARSAYGDLHPVRMVSGTSTNVTFIYPRGASDPDADLVRKSFVLSGNNFSSILGTVQQDIYIGRTAAGGVGDSIDIDNDSIADATFSVTTGFLMQLKNGEITRLETDRPVTAIVYGQEIAMEAYMPVYIHKPILINKVIASDHDGNVPLNTIDKDYNTRWSAYGNNQWIRYELDADAQIATVKIAWYKGDERQATFDIQTSSDTVNWVTVFSGRSSGKTLLPEDYSFPGANARFVRIVGHGNSNHLWNAITEVEILKDTSHIDLSSVIASTDDGNVPSNTIDKDFTTRWSAYGDNQWIRYYLDTATIVNTVKIAWYKGDLRKASFDLQTSLDGTSWQTVYSGQSSGNTTMLESYVISPASARYVQIRGHGNSMNLWNAITEVEIWKTAANEVSSIAAASVALTPIDRSTVPAPDVNDHDDLKIWPNPASGVFNIQTSDYWVGSELAVYDFAGKIVLRQIITQSSFQLNLSHLPQAANVISFRSKDKIIHRRIMLQK